MIRFIPVTRRRGLLRTACLSAFAGLLAAALLGAAASARTHTLTAEEMKLFNSISADAMQARKKMTLDPLLCWVARQRAAELAKTRDFSHIDKRGNGPNMRALKAGYLLPAYYERSKTANNIESIVRTTGSYRYAVKLWRDSPGHRIHVFGKASFYKGQTFVGIGAQHTTKGPKELFCVFLSAHKNESLTPPLIILKDAKGRILSKTRATRR